jgi:hypothetical protein
MSTEFSLEHRGTYLHARLAPNYVISREGMDMFWKAISKVCKEYECWRVLSEGSVSKSHMSTMDVFESGSYAAKSVRGLSLACCYNGYVPDELTEFFKNVAHNRGARVEYFSSRKRALEWLGVEQARQSGADAHDIPDRP